MAAASLTKLMTMILMLESYQDQLDTISITAPGYIYDYLYGKNASTADIWKGETHTLRSLLYAMLLPSANEAAYIVADYMSGSSIDNFVAMMNDEAARIGCTGTTFTDPCGLDPGNVTTARDAYLLVRVAMGYDAFAQAAGEESYQMPASTKHDSPYTILTSDKLVSPSSNYYRSYTKGGAAQSQNGRRPAPGADRNRRADGLGVRHLYRNRGAGYHPAHHRAAHCVFLPDGYGNDLPGG